MGAFDLVCVLTSRAIDDFDRGCIFLRRGQLTRGTGYSAVQAFQISMLCDFQDSGAAQNR